MCPKSLVKLIFPTKITWFQLFFFRPHFLNVHVLVALLVALSCVEDSKLFYPTRITWFQLFFLRPHFLNVHVLVASRAALSCAADSCKGSSSSSALHHSTVFCSMVVCSAWQIYGTVVKLNLPFNDLCLSEVYGASRILLLNMSSHSFRSMCHWKAASTLRCFITYWFDCVRSCTRIGARQCKRV